jgi:hypothetical protein
MFKKPINNCLINVLRSRTLSELTRQINSRTKNGHAPPCKKSWKDFNLSILLVYPVLVSFPVLSRIKPQIPLLVVFFRQFF